MSRTARPRKTFRGHGPQARCPTPLSLQAQILQPGAGRHGAAELPLVHRRADRWQQETDSGGRWTGRVYGRGTGGAAAAGRGGGGNTGHLRFQ